MRITHRNCLASYVSDGFAAMDIAARAVGKPSPRRQVPLPVQSLMRHELNLCLMLELFDERLTRFERSLSAEKTSRDYGAYAEAMAFLDTIYLFSRMLLDSAAGIVRHLYKCDTGHELPKSFDDMVKKSDKCELPNGLNSVFSPCKAWFPQLKDRRDRIVHHYETYFIGFTSDPAGRKTTIQFSPREETPTPDDEDLRSYIGMVMAGYQGFVDRLLDYWDEEFRDSHGISVFRNRTTFEGRSGNILWWAHRYGGYANDSLLISEL